MNVSVANVQSRSMTYSIVDTIDARHRRREQHDDAGVSRNDGAAAAGASDSSSPAVRQTELTITPPRSTMPISALQPRRVPASPAAHRPPRMNIIAETMKSTAAIRIFSHFADAAAPNFIPPHDPSCTPRHAAAASAGCSWPWP